MSSTVYNPLDIHNFQQPYLTRYVIGQLMTMLDADWSILQGWYHRADLAKFARQRQAMMRGNADARGHQLED